MKIKSSMEWFDLFVDAHTQQLFIPDRTEFLGLLSGKIGGFAVHIALNHTEIRNEDLPRGEIVELIRKGYDILLEPA